MDGGIVAGSWGYEAGQSGVGDIFAWFVEHAVPPEYHAEARRRGIGLHELLSEQAARQQPGAHGLIALDWLSGNRCVLVDHDLSGVIVGLTLATRPPDIYRALLESTAFGTRVIIDAFEAAGRAGQRADRRRRPDAQRAAHADLRRRDRAGRCSLVDSAQGPALGSAIHAAVAAGAYPDVAGGRGRDGPGSIANVYTPDPRAASVYDELYAEYVLLHDYFGRGANEVMHRLRALRDRVLGEAQKTAAEEKDHDKPVGAEK